MSYEAIKKFIQRHKAQLTTALACAVMFVVGFGTGRSFPRPNPPATNSYDNYSAKTTAEPEAAGEKEGQTISRVPTKDAPVEPAATANKPMPGQPCLIKGNITSSSKIYHIKGGASYDKVVPEACFSTETEAQAAGFRKAKR